MVPSSNRCFALFIHYGIKEWKIERDVFTADIESIVKRMVPDLAYLQEILKPHQGWQGCAFIFLDPGWTKLVEARRTGKSDGIILAQLGVDLANFRNAIEREIEGALSRRRCIQIVTAANLIELLASLRVNAPRIFKNAHQILAGAARQPLYDGPKLIEASIRIANIGRNVPILRFDDDVIFFGARTYGKKRIIQSRTRKAIQALCSRYKDFSDDPQLTHFVFSGSYLNPTQAKWFASPTATARNIKANQMTAMNGLATRVLQLSKLPKVPPRTVNELKMTRADLELSQVREFLQSLYKVGANPFRQVVSGAGLCLGDPAILDLPPFSNMRRNVVWIDDHLKFALHHELGHFGFGINRHTARVEQAVFPQLRHSETRWPTLTNVQWHLKEYLPRLIWGCIADAWLRADPHLKQPLKELCRRNPTKFRRLIKKVPGYYAREFQNALEGYGAAPAEVRNRLWQIARDRLLQVVTLWGDKPFADTFLGLFVSEIVYKDFTAYAALEFIPEYLPEGLAKAVTEMPSDIGKAQTSGFQNEIRILIDDFITYIDFVRFWKDFVQSVRLLLNQRDSGHEVLWLIPPCVRQALDDSRRTKRRRKLAKRHRPRVEPVDRRRTGAQLSAVSSKEYIGLEPPFSEEELRRAEEEGGGRPLADILADLERRQ